MTFVPSNRIFGNAVLRKVFVSEIQGVGKKTRIP